MNKYKAEYFQDPTTCCPVKSVVKSIRSEIKASRAVSRADIRAAQAMGLITSDFGRAVGINNPAASRGVVYLAVAPASYESYVYDAERKMIVVTMGDSGSNIAGKRFAMHAREEREAIEWTCRTIDLDRKYLPAACWE